MCSLKLSYYIPKDIFTSLHYRAVFKYLVWNFLSNELCFHHKFVEDDYLGGLKQTKNIFCAVSVTQVV